MAFELEPKSVISLDFEVLVVPPALLGGTTTYGMTLGGTTTQFGRYDRLT